ncbi:hypothetical protein SprV_0100303400 [Sparganum proliferum]
MGRKKGEWENIHISADGLTGPIRAYLGKNVSDFTVSSTAIRWRWQRPTLCYVEVKWAKDVYIDMDNVISVKKVGFESCCGPFGIWFPQSQSGFSIYSVCHLGSSRWGIEQWIATCPSTDADNYIREIQLFLRLKSVARPRSLLVFINPFGGRRRAEKIFNQRVFPIFELANILCTVVVTERQGHCKDYLLSEDLSVYDGVISVGGDGLFSELLHGVLYRQRMDSKLGLHAFHTPDSPEVTPRLRVGLIPAGNFVIHNQVRVDCGLCAFFKVKSPLPSLHLTLR